MLKGVINVIIDDKYMINESIKENIEVIKEGQLEIHGILTGDIYLKDNASLEHHGIINGSIYLYDNSKATLHGTINGDVINKGGTLEILGIVDEKVININGKTIINKDAIVGKERYVETVEL